jgi:spore germination protein
MLILYLKKERKGPILKKAGIFLFMCFMLLIVQNSAAATENHSFIIHKVNKGESLWKIAKHYHSPLKIIKQWNGLNSDQIVPGESLLIPGKHYTIQQGESLWDIAQRHALSVQKLAKRNGITRPSHIIAGTDIVIPQPTKRKIMTAGYLVPANPAADLTILKRYQTMVTQVGLFQFHPDWNGNLNPLNIEKTAKNAWRQGIAPSAVITNLTKEGFNSELVHHLLTTPSLRERLITNISRVLRDNDLTGVNIDFERVRNEDKALFTQFIKELSKKLSPVGFKISVAVPPKQGDQYPAYSNGYNYRALGKWADYVFLMTYDWHWSGSTPGAIAPIGKVRQTLDYAVKAIPKQKIFMGIPMYAYDWIELPEGNTQARAYSQQKALEKALSHGSTIRYDPKTKSPHFSYIDQDGRKHTVWFEDARSILAKYRLINRYGIRGMGGWRLGLPFPQAEEMIDFMFTVSKP